MTFSHPEKVRFISSSTRKKELFATVGDATTNIFNLPETSEAEFKSETVHILQKTAVLPIDLSIKGLIWEPKGNKILSYGQTQGHLFDLNAATGLSKPTMLPGLNTDNNEIYSSVWNPHSDRLIAFGIGRSVIEYDIRSNQ